MYAQCTTVCFGGFAGLDCRPCGSPRTVHSVRHGYDQFRIWIEEYVTSPEYGPIIVGLEPTGIYHEHWAYALVRDYGDLIELQLVNPYQTKLCRNQMTNGRHRKSDQRDVAAIALCLRNGLGQPACLPTAEICRFANWASAYRRLFKDKQRIQCHLRSELDRVWPGALINARAFRKVHPDMAEPQSLIKSDALQRDMVRLLIEFAADPYEWNQWSLPEICDFFHSHHYPCGIKTSQRFHQVAQQAMLLPAEQVNDLLFYLQNDWQRFLLIDQQFKQLRHHVDTLVPSTPAAVLTTVPGIKAFLAGGYLAYVRDVMRFRHADEIWSLAGFDVLQEDSGDASRRGKISRRGNPGLRNILYTIGFETSQTCPAIARAKAEALKRGIGPVGATIHAAHKANRMCFRLVRDQVAYDPKLQE